MTNINPESIVGREIKEGIRHADGRYKLRHMPPYQEMIGKRIEDIEEDTGRMFKIKFDDGCILSFRKEGEDILPCFDGNWDFFKFWPNSSK